MNLLHLTGLPRTGSTLLLYLLNQNPVFTIGPDSVISNLLYNNKEFIESTIYSFQLPHETVSECFIDFCRKGTEAWVDNICSKEKIFVDKSRDWIKNLNYTVKLFPKNKIIITIRDLRGIVNSFEKIHNNSLYFGKQHIDLDVNLDIQIQRVSHIVDLFFIKDGLLSLRELIDLPKKYADNLFICRYEDLIYDPKNELDKIYNFLNIPQFEHDFNNIKQETYTDNIYQPYGCHRIKSSIDIKQNLNKFSDTFSELREDIQKMIFDQYYWYYENFYPELI